MSHSIVEIGVARIQTTVAHKIGDINHLVETFLSNDNNTKKIIGLDIELAQELGRRMKIVLLQLCDGDHCLIVDSPSYTRDNLARSLFNFLNLPDFTFVGIGINKTMRKLESEWGLTCKNAVEIKSAKWNLYNKLGDEYEPICNIRSTPKPASPVFDCWGESFLEDNLDQLMYATYNAYLAFGLGNVMLDSFDY